MGFSSPGSSDLTGAFHCGGLRASSSVSRCTAVRRAHHFPSGSVGRIQLGQADFSLGDEYPTNLRFASVPPNLVAIGELIDMILERIAWACWFAELGLVDRHEKRETPATATP
jgi:hypothetical protein